MKLRTKTTSEIGISKWISILLLLACSVNRSVCSDTVGIVNTAVEVGNLELPVDEAKDNDKQKTHLEIAKDQLDWLLSKGGYYNAEKVAIKPVYENDPTSLGVFAVDDIKRGDILMKIPTSMILASSTYQDYSVSSCRVVRINLTTLCVLNLTKRKFGGRLRCGHDAPVPSGEKRKLVQVLAVFELCLQLQRSGAHPR